MIFESSELHSQSLRWSSEKDSCKQLLTEFSTCMTLNENGSSWTKLTSILTAMSFWTIIRSRSSLQEPLLILILHLEATFWFHFAMTRMQTFLGISCWLTIQRSWPSRMTEFSYLTSQSKDLETSLSEEITSNGLLIKRHINRSSILKLAPLTVTLQAIWPKKLRSKTISSREFKTLILLSPTFYR